MSTQSLVIGGGLTGTLLAIALARHGLHPVVLERGADYDSGTKKTGRSINLALAARGIRALRHLDVFDEVRPLLIGMRGRIVHTEATPGQLLPYGQTINEQIYSVSREELNRVLCRHARDRYGIEYRFGWEAMDIDPAFGLVTVRSPQGTETLTANVVFATDGAGSTVRKKLAAAQHVDSQDHLLDHGYKELTIPPANNGGFALDPTGLHVWPRGGFMLIALPNLDKTFTATLFLPNQGEHSFASLTTANDIEDFLKRYFADASRLMPAPAKQFLDNPIGIMGTVVCNPWSYGNRVLLVGDAAHAIVPFHGQGMNAAFEDCLVLDELIERFDADWALVFERFEARRMVNANAIAEMAIENYLEMRDTVRDPRFALRKSVAFELERRFPTRFIPRYSMVMFRPEIPYAEARRRGRLQAEILDRLTVGLDRLEDLNLELAEELIEIHLT